MILALTLGLMLALSVRAAFDWRTAAYGMIIMTQLQDPVRKLTPGAPGYLVLLAGPVLIGGLLGLIQAKPGWWSEFRAANPQVGDRVLLLILFCLPAAAISATYGAFSWTYTLLGVSSYSVLFLSIVMGFYMLGEENALRRLMAFYCLTTTVMLTGGWLEFLGMFAGSPLIGTDALNMEWIRYRGGYTVDLIAGFYRSPDVMGWHAAACGMFGVILLFTSRGFGRILWFVVILFAISALILCGRRKMAYMLPLFLLLIPILRFWVGRAQGAIAMSLSLGLMLIGALLLGDRVGGVDSDFLRYYVEGSVETVDRIEGHGLDSVLVTFRQNGFLGGGLGFATPGAQNIPFARPRVWQESGPSRLMFELGVPGLIALLLLGVALFGCALRSLSFAASRDARVLLYCSALFAFFLANGASLVVSGQILGDPFITAFIGISLGLVLGFRRRDRSSIDHAPLPVN